MTSKWDVNLAVRLSGMPPPRRLIMLVLADVADAKTGVIPDDRTPSLREISDWTGLDKATVCRHLDALDVDGWVIRERPDRETARRDRVRTTYRLDVPRVAQDDTDRVAENDTYVSQGATGQNGQDKQDGQDDPPPRVAENDTPRVAQDDTYVSQGATVPYTDDIQIEQITSSSAKPTTAKHTPPPERPDVEQICKHLADRIEANGSLRPSIGQGWRTAARLLLDKDGRTVEQIMRAIDWCQNHEFWRANIRSMPKLREQYDTLRLQAMRPNGRASPRLTLVEHNGMQLKPETLANLERTKRFEALDAQNALPAIGGTG